MAHISEHINSSNHKIHSYDQMVKRNVNLSNNKCEDNNNSTGHLSNIQKLSLMSIFDTSKNDVSNVDRKLDKRTNTYIFNKVTIDIIFLFNT